MGKWLRDTDLQHAIIQEEESQVSILHPKRRVPNTGLESGVNIRNRYNFSIVIVTSDLRPRMQGQILGIRGSRGLLGRLLSRTTLVSHAMRHRIRMQDTSWQFPTEDGDRDCRHCKHAY